VEVVERAAVLDDDGRELAAGVAGRLGVRTPTVTLGYWNDSNLTMKSSLSGYWLTGDVVRRDEAGRFYHLDRVPDVIHTANGAVYSLPMEEAILAGSPQVCDCAVFAVAAPGDPGTSVPFASVRWKSVAPARPAAADLLGTLNLCLAARGEPQLRGAGRLPDGSDRQGAQARAARAIRRRSRQDRAPGRRPAASPGRST